MQEPHRLDQTTDEQWWRTAVVYEIYLRSFADGDGDGVGDLTGVDAHLDYLCELGVDAIWFSPWYLSPQADGGYDVADYRRIDPIFGDVDTAQKVIAAARSRGIRTLIDIVPNHISRAHPWFEQALHAQPGDPARGRFFFRSGKGEDGSQPPNTWTSEFQGECWTRVEEADGTPGQWYLHLFTPDQPDLNWANPDVHEEFADILSFWFDKGVAGVRIDSAALIVKDPLLPDVPETVHPGQHPYLDRDGIHEIYRSWRVIADSYEEPRILVGEVWLPDLDRFTAYLDGTQMHTAFNFDFMVQPWEAAALRSSIERTLAAHVPIGAPPTWVLSNHDITRPVTRYGREDSSFSFASKRFNIACDLERGTRRSRAAALLVAALPGSLYIYHGDELGLPEVEDLPEWAIQDPMYVRNGRTAPGRDGCRVPLPWRAQQPGCGFGPPGAQAPWLPQPSYWSSYAVDRQQEDPDSMLNLYRAVLAVRRATPALRESGFAWLHELAGRPLPDSVLAFVRGEVCCLVNLGDTAVSLPADTQVLVASDPHAQATGIISPDAAVWWRATHKE